MTNRNNRQFCINGHDTAIVGRYSANNCKQCQKEYMQKRRKNNLANTLKETASKHKWRKNNPEKSRKLVNETSWRKKECCV